MTHSHAIHSGSRPHATVTRLRAALRTVVQAIADYRERRAGAHALMALDDRALKDIGLQRGQILAAAYGGLDRPRR